MPKDPKAADEKKAGDPAFPSLSETDVQRIAGAIMAQMENKSGQARGESGALPPGSKVAVRRTGWIYSGRQLDRGQVFQLTGLRNDGALVRLGYVQAVPLGASLETCGTCGAQFLDASSATAHYQARHVPKPTALQQCEPRRSGETAQEYELREASWRKAMQAQLESEDARVETQEDARAPLFLENTTASRT